MTRLSAADIVDIPSDLTDYDAELVRKNLQEVGITVDLVATDVAGWNQKQNEWEFDLVFTYLYQYGDPALGVARSYISSNIKKFYTKKCLI